MEKVNHSADEVMELLHFMTSIDFSITEIRKAFTSKEMQGIYANMDDKTWAVAEGIKWILIESAMEKIENKE